MQLVCASCSCVTQTLKAASGPPRVGTAKFGHGAADQHGQFDLGQQLGFDQYGRDVFDSGTQRDLDGGARASAGGFGRVKLCV